MQTGEYHFVTDSKNALFTDDDIISSPSSRVASLRPMLGLPRRRQFVEGSEGFNLSIPIVGIYHLLVY